MENGHERQASSSGTGVGVAAQTKATANAGAFNERRRSSYGVVGGRTDRGSSSRAFPDPCCPPVGISPVLEVIETHKREERWNRIAEMLLWFVVGCAVTTAFFVIRLT